MRYNTTRWTASPTTKFITVAVADLTEEAPPCYMELCMSLQTAAYFSVLDNPAYIGVEYPILVRMMVLS